jgi:arabinogalactan oligomer/maltooligosaccharide transport system substrate-binding protein
VSWTPLFASRGYLLNLDKYVQQSALSDYENAPVSTTREFPPGAACGTGPKQSAPLSYDKCNGHLYGLPQEIDFPELLFNRNELTAAGIKSPPATMHALRDDAVKIVEHRKETKATYGFEFGGTSYYALPFLYACGGGIFDKQGNILVNSPQSVAGLNFLVNLQNFHNLRLMPSVVNFSTPPGTMLPDFENGKTAMIFDGPHDISNIVNTKGSKFYHNDRDLGIAPIPTGAAKSGSPLGGESYVISASTAHPAEAYKFVKFMSSMLSQVSIANANYTLPTRKSVYNYMASHDQSSYQFISKFISRSVVDTVIAPPPIPQAGYLFDAGDPYIWNALTGAQGAEEALNAIAYSWNQLGGWKFIQSWPGASPRACS